jgi:iron complex outermembrane receptor protein
MLIRAARRMIASACPIVGVVSVAATVAAQVPPAKPPVGIPAVEVVATRIAEAPHDVPASIEVISGDMLRARGATSLKDALSLAAGISIAPGGDAGPASAIPEMWGLREVDAFLLVVDDIPWGGAFNPSVASLSLRDVERIEILRGPAPVTYGATSFVGVIHVVHKAAAADARYLSSNGGSFGSFGIAADLPLPISNAWKSRLSADFDKQGFKDDGTSYQRGHALWRVANVDAAKTKKTWFTADLNVLSQDPASPHPREGPALSAATPLDANHNPAGAYLDETRVALAAGAERLVFDGSTWGTTASFSHSAQKMFRGFLTDISNTPNNAEGVRENININDLYVDTHVVWKKVADWKFMTGADLLFGKGEAEGATFDYTAPLSGSTRAGVAAPTNFNLDANDSRTFLGVYGSAEWRPDPRLTLSAGLRLNSTSERRGDADAVTNSRVSGGLGALFSLWEQGLDHVRLFANYRDTFKPAAVDFGLGAADEDVLKPETSQSYEGGVKFRGLDGRVDVEASYFHMDFENLVTSTIVNNQPALINSGKTRFQGFELAADFKLADATWARASYSAHDGKFVDFVQSFDGVPTQLAGKRVEMSAKQLWSAGIAYAPEAGFMVNASINSTGDRYLNMRNTALAPAFQTIDAGIGYRTGRWEWRLDVRNLGDARDPVSESEFGDAQYYRMPARTFRAGVVVKY